ncbi:hypothetical protein [Spirosoma panaciterrae]|uniref:hypothetical protein n=1 Tax=Spirosoma panaciterrae TaxID=496058 RepID=UPI0012F9CAC8|nr:hypothetical protein [Spirosoma panaciterrae]
MLPYKLKPAPSGRAACRQKRRNGSLNLPNGAFKLSPESWKCKHFMDPHPTSAGADGGVRKSPEQQHFAPLHPRSRWAASGLRDVRPVERKGGSAERNSAFQKLRIYG